MFWRRLALVLELLFERCSCNVIPSCRRPRWNKHFKEELFNHVIPPRHLEALICAKLEHHDLEISRELPKAAEVYFDCRSRRSLAWSRTLANNTAWTKAPLDRAKTLDQINKGEGGFLDRDLIRFAVMSATGSRSPLAILTHNNSSARIPEL
jgi:hypothetical protein